MRTYNSVVVCISLVCTHILYFLWRSFSRRRASYSLFEFICIFLYSWKELRFLCSWKTTLHNTLFYTENANPSCWIFAITLLKEFFPSSPLKSSLCSSPSSALKSGSGKLIAWLWPGRVGGRGTDFDFDFDFYLDLDLDLDLDFGLDFSKSFWNMILATVKILIAWIWPAAGREGEAVGVRLTANLADGQLAVKFKMKVMMMMITMLTWWLWGSPLYLEW